MIRILANDGIDAAGKKIFADAGIEVVTEKIPQDKLTEDLKNFDAILVRSATQVRKELIDACPELKLIGRAGVGMDNIDVTYAREKNIHVVNTPEASSQSVAELVIAQMFTMARLLHDSNRKMTGIDTKEQFDVLKKKYSNGIELRGKTLGVIGFGQIGQTVAKLAIALGMRVLPFRRNDAAISLAIDFFKAYNIPPVKINLNVVTLDELLSDSDFITLHVPFPKGTPPVIGKREFEKMKKGVCIINTARGGAMSETDLLEALNSGIVAHAALDVFEGEPIIAKEIRQHASISLTPHIGGSTKEAQERIGIELAEKVVHLLKK